MIRVTVDSIRVSLLTQQRMVMLREADSQRLLPIWIGAFEAEAIATALQGHEPPRPMTHDLLKNIIAELGGTVVGGSPAEFGAIISEATEKWAKVIKFAGIKAE